jgi:ribonucleotide monophosphatase NagD (HAD superfamily)
MELLRNFIMTDKLVVRVIACVFAGVAVSFSMPPTGLMGRGMVARRYQDSGGIVNYIGKPHSLIYKECIKLLQTKDVYPAQTVMLGDSMSNDVVGASMVGLDTCLFKSGIHSANFAHCENLKEVNNALRNLMAQYGNIMPTYLMDEMKWGNALPDRKHKKRKQPSS